MAGSLASVLYTPRPVTPFDGEALFSFLGRYLHATAPAHPIPFQRAVLGRYPYSLSLDMPGRLEWMRQNLPTLRGLTLEEMVQRFTAAPIFHPFRDEDRWTALVQRLGASSPRIGDDREFSLKEMHRRPRHCRLCMQAQLRKFGLVFWPREFGLRLLLACPTHGVLLEEMPCQSHLFLRFNRGFAAPSLPEDGAAAPASESQKKLAKLVVDLLHSGTASIPGPLLVEVYRKRLREMGFVYSRDRIDRKAFAGAARQFWGDLEFAKFSDDSKLPEWMRSMNTPSPLKHLLMIGFLFGSVAAWRQTVQAAQKEPAMPPSVTWRPFGLTQPVKLDDVRASPLKGTNKITLSKWEKVLAEQPLACGKPMEPVLKELLECGLPIKEVVSKSGIPTMTVYRRLKANHDVLRRWAAQVLKREYDARFIAQEKGGVGTARRAESLSGKKGWLYSHRRALLMVQDQGLQLDEPVPGSMKMPAARKRSRGGGAA